MFRGIGGLVALGMFIAFIGFVGYVAFWVIVIVLFVRLVFWILNWTSTPTSVSRAKQHDQDPESYQSSRRDPPQQVVIIIKHYHDHRQYHGVGSQPSSRGPQVIDIDPDPDIDVEEVDDFVRRARRRFSRFDD